MPERKTNRTQVGHSPARLRLAALFERNGYIRAPSDEQRQRLGEKYKKGWEVRLALHSREELSETRRLLGEVGIRAGKPYKKEKQWVQPIYGKNAVDIFTGWVARVSPGAPRES
jgi:hypothetical protein